MSTVEWIIIIALIILGCAGVSALGIVIAVFLGGGILAWIVFGNHSGGKGMK